MKANKLRNMVDRVKPHFEKGGRFAALHSAFDAIETFLFVPNEVTAKGTHIRDGIDMKRTMIIVVIALLPALLFGMFNVGYQHFLSIGEALPFFSWQGFWFGFLKVLPIILVSYITGLGIEIIFAQMKGHQVAEGFFVSGMLIPLIMPIDTPLWMIALATAFAVIFGKEVFGGSGMNIFNPALLARVFVFFAYPAYMTGDRIWVAGMTRGEGIVDGFSGATPLGNAAADSIDRIPGFLDLFLGTIPGSIGETSTLAILLGAVLLLVTGIGSWKIMLSALVGGVVMGGVLNIWGANSYMEIPFYSHLVMGGFAFGVVFMATDPVTAAQTETGKWIYGFLIGFLSILIRVVNPAYPEGVMLAILLMNMFAPLIDYYVVQANIKRRLKRVKSPTVN
ncbi:MAG: NADH:ubiquinone reductase (Na(+)-transporting) subunit B [Bacteroidales bacterium]|jgi:Na+-transporting NADH:ubiquinone oxidoreductase subunit B|nr:NADH:ubiquinone reductase (Na(+)-transporting) subunit B [Bacteroidales bacterium]MDD2569964.1 NADH:ubiquinone reductase (Na(+)-transporting) subunit B [Bacteroidales bacterium]MDD2812739.1 NADH:ubiquinone reductase (Na(+)-transporting) subunit B [Bacteroidales bacterium]MDD3385892.1 NADH:ubiquinone reductase (Na(+)-transporting) subunit B [Bacteroidales bacterium]MDD3810694.1 NADH:ubiquinone reductase (Na(+)-transporting) subunit B [Bacteroidales bacterium]